MELEHRTLESTLKDRESYGKCKCPQSQYISFGEFLTKKHEYFKIILTSLYCVIMDGFKNGEAYEYCNFVC